MTDLKTTWVLGEQYAHTDQNDTATAVNANTHARPSAGKFSARPAAGSPGALYLSEDSQTLFRDDGTAWHAWGPLQRFATPPSSGLSTTALGTAAFTADKDERLLTAPSAAGYNWRIEYSALSPSSGYTATAYIETCTAAASTMVCGIVLLNSSSGSFVSFGAQFAPAGQGLFAGKWTSATSTGTNYGGGVALGSLWEMPKWLRIVDDGTTRFFQYSFNGVDWLLLTSVARSDFVTPDSVGWGCVNNGTGSTALIRLRSFNVTSP